MDVIPGASDISLLFEKQAARLDTRPPFFDLI
jgi:hypothetical protein